MKDLIKKFWPLILPLAMLAGLSGLQYSVLLSGRSCQFLKYFPGCDAAAFSPFILIAVLLLLFCSLIYFYSGIYSKRFAAKEGRADLVCIAVTVFSVLLSLSINQFATGDPEYYFNAGRAVHYGINPYLQEYAGGNQFYSEEKPVMPAGVMYGPLMIRAFAGLHDFSSANIFIFVILLKLLCLIFFLACGWLIYSAVKEFPMVKNISCPIWLLWLAAPLVLFEWLANAHFDGIWLALVLTAYVSAQKRRWQYVWPLLTLAIWLKFVPLLFLPIFVLWWWQETDLKEFKAVRNLLVGALLSLIITIISWWGLWGGLAALKGISVQSKWAAHSIFYSLYYGLAQLIGQANERAYHFILSGGLQLALLLAAFWLMWPLCVKAARILWRKEKFSAAQFSLMAFIGLASYLLLVQKSIWPWYFIWLLPFGIIAWMEIPAKRLKKILAWIGAVPLLFYCLAIIAEASLGLYWFSVYACAILAIYPLYQLIYWRSENYSMPLDKWQIGFAKLARMDLFELLRFAFFKTKSLHFQFIKYFATGLSAFALDMLTLFALKDGLGLTPTWAIVINQILLFNFVFFVNKLWSFKVEGMTHKQMVRYLMVSGFNYLFSVAWMWSFTEHFGFNYLVVRTANIILAVSWNFLLYKFFVYKK